MNVSLKIFGHVEISNSAANQILPVNQWLTYKRPLWSKSVFLFSLVFFLSLILHFIILNMQRRTALLTFFAIVVALFIGVSTVQADDKEAYGTGKKQWLG
jgi:lipopolysaccharide export LptBFGC system permease protein LptF